MPKRKASEMEKPGFTVQCPAKAPPQTESRSQVLDVFAESDTPGPTELQIDYTIVPGTEWNEMRRYRNVKYQDNDFPVDSFILVNRTYPPPAPPPADASKEQILHYQRTNMWVGKIREARAQSEHRVFLRVFWLYWPEELPGGPQVYHGQQELVLSNHVEVVEATTISGPAEVSHWDEQEDSDGDEDERPLYPLFWRQTLDLKPGPNGKPTLSVLRKHCVCRKEYNPDRIMFKCMQDSCGIWNHKECLEKDVEDTAGLATPLLPVATPLPLATPKARGRPPKHDTKGDKLQVSVQESGGRDRGTIVARVKLVPGKGSTTDAKEWTIKANCLKCSHPLE
ncbi:hypothetical protein DV737_g2642, partial [Chaetothyriales sp. CBS 132003]